MIGTGIATGEGRAVKAVNDALSNPILDDLDITGAKNVLINIASNGNIGFDEIDLINCRVQESAGEKANYIFGLLDDREMDDEVMVTVIATGFRKDEVEVPAANESTNDAIRNAEGYDLGSTGKITVLPKDLNELKVLDRPAVERRYKDIKINDDLSDSYKPSIDKKLNKYGFDDTDPVDQPAFMRRSLD